MTALVGRPERAGAVTAIADERGEPPVVLEGNPRYSARFGFVHSAPRGIELPLPDWAPAEVAQVLLLRSYVPDDGTLRGCAVHPTAFDSLDDDTEPGTVSGPEGPS